MSRICVIGAGLGGLALAIRLQSSGAETTLIEAHDRPGGQSWTRVREGFTFDSGPAALADPSAFAELWQLSGGDMTKDVKLLPLALLRRLSWPDGAVIDMTGGREDSGAAMRREIARVAPEDAAGYEEFLRWSDLALRDGAAPWQAAPRRDLAGIARSVPLLARHQAWRSVHGIAASFVKSAKLREAISVAALAEGANPLQASAFHALSHKHELDHGLWWPKGGMGRLAAAMANLFEKLGGNLVARDPVLHIHTLGDRASEVECVSGWRQRFDGVASSADLVHTYRDLLASNQRGPEMARQLVRRSFAPSSFTVYFGLAGSWPGIPHNTVLFGPRYRGLIEDIFDHGVLPRDFIIFPAACLGDRSQPRREGQERVPRDHPGGQSGQAADRLGSCRAADRAAHNRRSRAAADPRYRRPHRHQIPYQPARPGARLQRLGGQHKRALRIARPGPVAASRRTRRQAAQSLFRRQRGPAGRRRGRRTGQRESDGETHPRGSQMKRIAVYCGSASPADPRYLELAREVGDMLAGRGIGVVYGGGRMGLMGALAGGALAAGGEVIGVIPESLVEAELANPDCTELRIVAGMHERKLAFTELADGFLTLPGGVGTMDEMWEAVSWAQLGYHAKPVGLLNAFGFFDHLLAFNRHMAEIGFVREAHRGILLAERELGMLLTRMAAHEPVRTIVAMRPDEI